MTDLTVAVELPEEQAPQYIASISFIRQAAAAKLRTGRCSLGLILELTHCLVTGSYDIYSILDRIGF